MRVRKPVDTTDPVKKKAREDRENRIMAYLNKGVKPGVVAKLFGTNTDAIRKIRNRVEARNGLNAGTNGHLQAAGIQGAENVSSAS